MVAFAIGAKYAPGNGFHMIGAHTDSPCLKLKPKSKGMKSDFLTINIETYGGGLWHTWFDRDLSVAGRVLVRSNDNGSFSHKLVKIKKPILRIPMLAIHLYRNIYTEGFKPNHQSHLAPVLATKIKTQLEEKDEKKTENNNTKELQHHPLLIKLISEELKYLNYNVFFLNLIIN